MKHLIFIIQEHRFAIKLTDVERVIRAVEVTPIPNQSKLLGVINIQGAITPVINTYSLFNLTLSEIGINDRFIIVRAGKRQAVLVANEVDEVIEKDWQEIKNAEKFQDRVEIINGVLKLPDGLVLIVDLEKLFSADEEELLNLYGQ
ncbi:hypothetical protein JCM14036_08210 [Desulfotomaculum defluvii]